MIFMGYWHGEGIMQNLLMPQRPRWPAISRCKFCCQASTAAFLHTFFFFAIFFLEEHHMISCQNQTTATHNSTDVQKTASCFTEPPSLEVDKEK